MNIKWIGSPNFSGRNGGLIKFIVNHVSSGTLSSMDNWFLNPKAQASAHYGIGKDGSIHQYVKDSDKSWHSGNVTDNNNPIYRELGIINPNNVSIGIEHEGMTGELLTEEQYQATLWLHRELIKKYGISIDREHIIGHYQIDPKNRTNCPGKAFPWGRLMGDLLQPQVKPQLTKEQELNNFAWELAQRKIISDSDKWIKNGLNNDDVYWLMKKTVAFLQSKNV